ncbi:MAG TPA: hypothetical protein VMO26_27720 [Vicinamibacterales bacterium]|nr:hypothetical protein [Vicinamibacterales bacterium]
MPKLVFTCQVEDGAEWEKKFQTHGDLFKSATITGSIAYGINDKNEVGSVFEVTDLEKYMEVLSSQAAAEVMAHDGVKKETVKVFVVNREYRP